ncbi:MAG: ThuA domain-containing protein [Candidatus Sumerlaeota bacterium]|nr:ThuA domain-containing protein [Candidatus Sumerlaeota bacterium]
MRSIRNIAVCMTLAAGMFLAISLAGAQQPKPAAAPKAPEKKEQREMKPDEIQKMTAAMPEKATAQPAKSRKILVFWKCDGFFHKDGISAGNKAIEMMGQKTGAYSTVITDDITMLEADKLKDFDAVVLNNTTQLNPSDSQKKGLLEFVKGGKGVFGIHAAVDNFTKWPEGAEMMGGLFDGHPWGGGSTVGVKIDEPDHPLAKAFAGKGFEVKDEIYQLKTPYSRDTHRVLSSLDMDNPVTMNKIDKTKLKRQDMDYAISYMKTCGGGRVFYGSLGHNAEIFWNKGVLQQYLDAIQWVIGDMKADVTPSAKLASKPKAALSKQ